MFLNADLIAQVLIDVYQNGYTVKLSMYDKPTDSWSFDIKLVDEMGSGSVEDRVADYILPLIQLHMIELAQPSQASILFADCLKVEIADSKGASSTDPRLLNTAHIFSILYPDMLNTSATVRKRFNVVPLVPTIDLDFFRWWCMSLKVPHLGWLRNDDTTEVYGMIIPISSSAAPKLFLEAIRSSHRRTHSSDAILLDLSNRSATLQRITETVEKLLNDP